MVENLGVEPATQETPKNTDKIDSIGLFAPAGEESLPLRQQILAVALLAGG